MVLHRPILTQAQGTSEITYNLHYVAYQRDCRQAILCTYQCKAVGGGPGIGGGFELRSVFLFKFPAPGKSSWVKKVQIPHTRVIIIDQKNSTNDQKSLPQADV